MKNKTQYPWDQQPNEPEEIYQMFKHYINITEGRSYKAIASIFGKGVSTISRYAKKWNWTHRTELYVQHIRENFKLTLIEFCKQFEEKKFSLKIDLSFLSYEIAQSLRNYLDHFEIIYKNPDVLKRLKFFREISRTIKQVFSMSDFSLNADMFKTKLLRDVNLKSTQDIMNTTLILNDNKSINLSVNSIIGLIKAKTGKSTTIDTTNFETPPNSFDDNDYPKLNMAAIYAADPPISSNNKKDDNENE